MSFEEDILVEFKSNAETAIESLRIDLKKLRTGRANISLLDGVRIDYYGSSTPLSQCANLSVPDARTINIKPWDKGIIVEIEKAITRAGLGLNPQNDGEMIRLPIPSLTEDRRKDLVKQSKARGEDAKVSIRNARRDANEMLKVAEKDKEISEDELKRALENVQEITQTQSNCVDAVLTSKEEEILEI
jgi:ribosome recycling factor